MLRLTGQTPNDPTEALSPEQLRQLRLQVVPVIRRALSRSHLDQPENIADVFQQVLLILFCKNKTPDGSSDRTILAYRRKVAWNAAMRFAKKEIKQQRLHLAEVVHGGAYLPEERSPYERLLVKDSLAKLSREKRQLIMLTYIRGWSVREIQARLGYPTPEAVRTAQCRALRDLTRIIQGTLRPSAPARRPARRGHPQARKEEPCDP